jgi:hypothetical protein
VSLQRYFNGNLKASAPQLIIVNGLWVRMINNQNGMPYVSAAATDALGNYAVTNLPLGSYRIETGPASIGPWTPVSASQPPQDQGDLTFRPTLTPAAVAQATSAEQTFALPGLVVGDVVVVNPPSLVAGLAIAHARVSAVDTLAIAWINTTAGSLTPASGTYLVDATRN